MKKEEYTPQQLVKELNKIDLLFKWEYNRDLDLFIKKPKNNVIFCGKEITHEKAPESVNGRCDNKNCKNAKLIPMYGIQTPYGMGTYNFCNYCGTVYDFVEDYESPALKK